jgi:hypothetical protein
MIRAALATIVVLVGSLPALAQEEPTDEELLASFDTVRFFDDDVTSVRIRIRSETPDEVTDGEIVLYFAEIDGEPYTRIEYLVPLDLVGQGFVGTPDGTFFFGPDLDGALEVGGTTEVFGDAAAAQTSGIRFADDYAIDARRTVTRDDGRPVIELDLAARDESVAFQAVTLRVDPDTLRPLSSILYTQSMLPYYEVFYEEYVARETGDVYVRVQRIEHRIFVGRTTVSEILDLGTDILDPTLFDLESLRSNGTSEG